MNTSFVIGIDPGKYFFSTTLLEGDGTVRWKGREYEMNREGFNRLTTAFPGPNITIGVEASGRIDENLMAWLRQWVAATQGQARLIRVNPGQSARFGTAKPRRDRTDTSDAWQVAEYTRVYGSQLPSFEQDSQAQSLARRVSERKRLVEDATALKNRLHDQLIVCFPEFTKIFKDPFAVLARAVLRQVPTAAAARTRKPLSLARIQPSRRSPSLGVERARQLIELAQQSVASADAVDGEAVLYLLDQLDLIENRVGRIDASIRDYIQQDEKIPSTQKAAVSPSSTTPSPDERPRVSHQIRLADTLPGIGLVAAADLVLGSRGLDRFHSGKALAAQWAVCPQRVQTGISYNKSHLTQRGDHQRRSMLYLSTQTACNFDAAFAFHKWRAMRAGQDPQQAVCTCMNRMTRVLHQVVMSNRPYDVNHMIAQIQIHHAGLWKTFLHEQAGNKRIWKKVDRKWLKAA